MDDISKLGYKNFLSICDVALDISEELQMASENIVYIKLLNNIIKFRELYPPVDSIGARNDYCDLRYKAINYLKQNKHINDYEVIGDFHCWDNQVKIIVDKEKFKDFSDKLINRKK